MIILPSQNVCRSGELVLFDNRVTKISMARQVGALSEEQAEGKFCAANDTQNFVSRPRTAKLRQEKERRKRRGTHE